MSDLIKIQLPFSGFYESIHSSILDDALELHFSDDHGDLSEEAADAIYMADVDWTAIHNEYAKEYAEELGYNLELDIQFDELTSPKYYNFSTDKIYATIPADQMKKIRDQVEQHEKWPQYLEDHYKSYDGFISFYSYDPADEVWTRDILDECQYHSMLDFWMLEIEGYDYSTLEYSIIDSINAYELDTINDAAEAVHKYMEEQK